MLFFDNQLARRARATGGRVLLMLALSGSAWGQCFKTEQPYTVGSSPYSIAPGDFNGDGRLDLATANDGDNNVSVLLGTGTGTFQAALNYATGSNPRAVAVGDFNGDSRLDLAVANFMGRSVSVLLGGGDGTFAEAVNYPINDFLSSVAVGDFNGDSNLDLVVDTSLGVSVLLGTGTGAFGEAQFYDAGTQTYAVAVGDFNGDTKPDLAVTNIGAHTVTVLLGVGNGTFGAAQSYAVGTTPVSVAVGDFNVDGDEDLAVANSTTDNVSVLLGNGNGTFQSAVNYAAGDGAIAVAVGDFNGDTKPDLVTANFNSNNASVLLGTGTGTFATAVNFATGSGAQAAAVGDFDADGKADLAVANRQDSDVSVLLNAFGVTPTLVVGGAPVCAGQAVTVDVNAPCATALTLQLSNAAGDFASPTALGGAVPGSQSATIPLATPAGAGYRIRVLDGGTATDTSAAFTVDGQTLSVPSLSGTPLCAGQALKLSFTASCPATFEAQLSDATGSFASPVSLGNVAAGSSQSVTIPAGTVTGTGYRIRVVSTDPTLTSDPSEAFAVTLPGVVTVATPTTPARVCFGEPLPVTFALTGSGCLPTGGVYTVQLSSAVGSFATPTSLGTTAPGTTLLTLPGNLLPGTGYRVRVVGGGQVSPASLSFRVEGPSLAGVAPTVSGAPICRGQALTVRFALPATGCPFPEGNAFTVQLSSAMGSFNNPTLLGTVLAGVSNSVVIPATVGAGSGYRIRIAGSPAGVVSGSSAPVAVRACNSRLSAPEDSGPELVVMPNPVATGGNAFPGEIRVRVRGMDSPTFTLTNLTGRNVGISTNTDPESSGGEFVLTPRYPLTPGVYTVQASEGQTRITRRVLVVE